MNMSSYSDVQWSAYYSTLPSTLLVVHEHIMLQWPAISLCLAIGLVESQEQGQANWWACTKSQCLS